MTLVDPEGKIWVGDVVRLHSSQHHLCSLETSLQPVGDVWNFPNAYAHSIQAKNVDTEFIVAFELSDYGRASGYTLSDWFAHTPKATLAKNFGWTDPALLDHIPKAYTYLFPCKHAGPMQNFPFPSKVTSFVSI